MGVEGQERGGIADFQRPQHVALPHFLKPGHHHGIDAEAGLGGSEIGGGKDAVTDVAEVIAGNRADRAGGGEQGGNRIETHPVRQLELIERRQQAAQHPVTHAAARRARRHRLCLVGRLVA